MMAQERLLITGAGGMEGRVLAQLAYRQGFKTSGIFFRRYPQEIKDLADEGLINMYSVDLRDTDETRRVIADVQPQIVVHLAGHALDNSALGAEVYNENMAIFENVLSGVKDLRYSPRLVVNSSIVVYGRPLTGEMMNEVPTTLLPEPDITREFYRWSKFDQEMRLLDETGLDWVVARTAQHTGAARNPNVVEVDIAKEVTKILRHETDHIEVRNKAGEVDLSDAGDVARAYLILARSGNSAEVYHVTSGRPSSIESVAKELLQIAGLDPIKYPVVSTRKEEITYCRFSSQKLMDLGWIPQHTLAEALAVFWRDFQSVHSRSLCVAAA